MVHALLSKDKHRVGGGHAGLSSAALNAGEVFALASCAIRLAELVVNSRQQGMRLPIGEVQFRRSRQFRTRFRKSPEFERRFAREKMSVCRVRPYRRYHIVTERDIMEAGRRIEQFFAKSRKVLRKVNGVEPIRGRRPSRDIIDLQPHGGCSSAGRALDCGSSGRGFESHHPPQVIGWRRLNQRAESLPTQPRA